MTPIERIARVMCAKAVELDMDDGQSWLVLAATALQAIREPSEAMIVEGMDWADCEPTAMVSAWHFMIDAALREEA